MWLFCHGHNDSLHGGQHIYQQEDCGSRIKQQVFEYEILCFIVCPLFFHFPFSSPLLPHLLSPLNLLELLSLISLLLSFTLTSLPPIRYLPSLAPHLPLQFNRGSVYNQRKFFHYIHRRVLVHFAYKNQHWCARSYTYFFLQFPANVTHWKVPLQGQRSS